MFKFTAVIRKDQGKGASRRLRHINKIPAIIYGGNETPVAIELDHNAIINAQAHEEFYSENIVIDIEGKEAAVKVQAIQRHPFKPKVMHIDFIRV